MKNYSERPWGFYEVITKSYNYWVKRITVKPSQRLSLQYHGHRAEEWIIVQGEGTAWVNGVGIPVSEGSHVHISVGDEHRIANSHPTKHLIFIEVALGEDLRENDIVRVQDDYGREK